MSSPMPSATKKLKLILPSNICKDVAPSFNTLPPLPNDQYTINVMAAISNTLNCTSNNNHFQTKNDDKSLSSTANLSTPFKSNNLSSSKTYDHVKFKNQGFRVEKNHFILFEHLSVYDDLLWLDQAFMNGVITSVPSPNQPYYIIDWKVSDFLFPFNPSLLQSTFFKNTATFNKMKEACTRYDNFIICYPNYEIKQIRTRLQSHHQQQ